MNICYLIESIPGHLPHLLPLYKSLGGVLTSSSEQVLSVLIKNGYKVIPYEALKYIHNIIVAHQCNLKDICSNSNIIQVFHGVSDKTYYYLSHLPDHYDYLIFQYPEARTSWLSVYPEYVEKAYQANHTKASCYLQETPTSPEDYILYCPTWKSAEISEELKGAKEINELGMRHKIKVHLHPATNKETLQILDNCEILFESEYLEDELKKARLLISDFSSMAYEFTLTRKPIILIKNSMIKPKLADYCPWIDPSELEATIENISTQNYPHLFYEEDIREVVKRCLK